MFLHNTKSTKNLFGKVLAAFLLLGLFFTPQTGFAAVQPHDPQIISADTASADVASEADITRRFFEGCGKWDAEQLREFVERNNFDAGNARDEETGNTGFHYAARENPNTDVFDLLLEFNVPVDALNKQGRNALHEAMLHGYYSSVNWLMNMSSTSAFRSIDPKQLPSGGNVRITPEDSDTLANIISPISNTALSPLQTESFMAIADGNLEKLKTCLNNNEYDVNFVDKIRGTPLIYAIRNNADSEIVKTLLDYGALADMPWEGLTPLDWASGVTVESGNKEAFFALLDRGAKVWRENETSSSWYEEYKQREIIDLQGVKDIEGITVEVSSVTIEEMHELVRRILDPRLADVNVDSGTQSFAQQLASQYGNNFIQNLPQDLVSAYGNFIQNLTRQNLTQDPASVIQSLDKFNLAEKDYLGEISNFAETHKDYLGEISNFAKTHMEVATRNITNLPRTIITPTGTPLISGNSNVQSMVVAAPAMVTVAAGTAATAAVATVLVPAACMDRDKDWPMTAPGTVFSVGDLGGNTELARSIKQLEESEASPGDMQGAIWNVRARQRERQITD